MSHYEYHTSRPAQHELGSLHFRIRRLLDIVPCDNVWDCPMRTLCILLLIASALPAQLSDPDSRSERNPFAGQSDAILAGKKLFAASCSGCHGANGEGGRGPSLIEGRMIRRSSDMTLFASIRKGIPGTDMPPPNLPDDEIWRVIAFVRDLSAPAYESKLAGNPDAGADIFFGKGGCA